MFQSEDQVVKTKIGCFQLSNGGFLKISVVYNARPLMEPNPLLSRKSFAKATSPFPSPRLVSKATYFADSRLKSNQEKKENSKNLFFSENRRDSLCLGGVELFGSLIGSYEESILTGRMSTLPSKPIDFIAEIGVLGHGKLCPSHLRSPSHIFVPFSAYFYDLPGEDFPTPFVGLVDISKSIFALPFKGQLQIMIRNLNNTVIKIFILPFDFRDMPAFSKTFLRQKAFGSCKNMKRLKHAIHVNFEKIGNNSLSLVSPLRVVFSSNSGEEKIENHIDGPSDPKYSLIMDHSHSTIR